MLGALEAIQKDLERALKSWNELSLVAEGGVSRARAEEAKNFVRQLGKAEGLAGEKLEHVLKSWDEVVLGVGVGTGGLR